jgi:hypothetical protein
MSYKRRMDIRAIAFAAVAACGGAKHGPPPPPETTESSGATVTSESIAPPKDFGLDPGTGGITGSVSDTAGHRVAGVSVMATGGPTSTAFSGASDNAGRFAIPSLPPGTYTISFLLEDERLVQRNVVISANRVTLLRVTKWKPAS